MKTSNQNHRTEKVDRKLIKEKLIEGLTSIITAVEDRIREFKMSYITPPDNSRRCKRGFK